MLFMVTETWPTGSSVEVGKAAVEALAKALPPYIKRLGPYIAPGGDGIKAYNFYEVEKGHEDEGYKELMKEEVPYLSIGGYKFTVEPLLSAEEALPLVGL